MDWRKHTVEVSLLLCRCQWSAASVQSTRVPLHRHAYASVLLVTPCVNNGAVGKQTNASAEESAIAQPSALGGSRGAVKGFASRSFNFCASFARVIFRSQLSAFRFSLFAIFAFLLLLLPKDTLAPHAKNLYQGEGSFRGSDSDSESSVSDCLLLALALAIGDDCSEDGWD